METSTSDDGSAGASPAFGAAAGEVVAGVRRMAVLRANSIGDFVLALPALAALRAAYPRAEITYLGDTWHPYLLDGRSGPWDRVDVVPPYPGVVGNDPATRDSPDVRRFLAAQRARSYDLAVQIHGGGANSNPLVARLGARITAGLRDDGAPALDREVPYWRYQHEVHRFLEVAGLVGAEPVGLQPRLQVEPADRNAAERVLRGARDCFVAIHSGANDARRRWPAESFASVAEALMDRGAQVVLVGRGDDDAAAAAQIVSTARRGRPLNLVGQLSLSETVGVLAACRMLVGNDSGPRHLAAAVGTPTVGIYWWKNLLNTGPLTAAGSRVAVSFRATCPICGAEQVHSRCAHDSSMVADVPVDEVISSAIDLYLSAAEFRPRVAAAG
jgi:ADP-heptose:LPS heptosyltransferase